MVRYENECVCCPKEMGCLGDSCPYIKVKRIYCDNCDEDCTDETDTPIRNIDGEQICMDCFLEKCEEYFKSLPKIDLDDIE